jgi:two-component system nitrogen regulation response regulator GlnG
MASGKQILLSDLPAELTSAPKPIITSSDGQHSQHSWQDLLAQWVTHKLATGAEDILAEAGPEFERIVLKQALQFTHGHKQDAAKRLGWGRNTLTRKLKELDME